MLAVAYRLVDLAIDSGSAPELLTVQQKSSSEGIRGRLCKRSYPKNLGSWRNSRGRTVIRCGRTCRLGGGRSRTGFSCRRRSRGSWACRRLGSSFGLLLARREERGTGQDADVFFHSGIGKGILV